VRTEHENGLSSLFDKRFEINLKVKLVLGTNSFQSNRSHLRTQRYTNHTHTQNVRPRERWQWHARKWIAKQSNRKGQHSKTGEARHTDSLQGARAAWSTERENHMNLRFRTDMFRLLMSLMMIMMIVMMIMMMMMMMMMLMIMMMMMMMMMMVIMMMIFIMLMMTDDITAVDDLPAKDGDDDGDDDDDDDDDEDGNDGNGDDDDDDDDDNDDNDDGFYYADDDG